MAGERRYIRGRVLRVTKLDGCGNVVLGPDSRVDTKGFISVGLTPNTQTGTAIQQENANGDLIIDDTPVPKFRNWALEFNFIGVNPQLLSLMTGQPVELNADGTEVIGFRVNSKIDVELLGFAAELWTGVATEVCEGGAVEFGYMLIPFVKGGVVGAVTVENGAINFSVTGAISKDGTGWGVGPYDVVEDEDGEPGPLNVAADTGDHLISFTTSVEPPDADENGEAQEVGVKATGAAGVAHTYSPANSYGPKDLADFATFTLTKTPSTAWVTGSYVLTREGDKVHWNGTTWIAGAA